MFFMQFDKITGLWKEVISEAKQVIAEETQEEDPEQEDFPPDGAPSISSEPKVRGKCVLTFRIENHGEYLKWQKYNPGRQWEFVSVYPALMRAEYSFRNSLEVEMMAKKIVQLLTIGFDVYSANWKLERAQGTDEIANETTLLMDGPEERL